MELPQEETVYRIRSELVLVYEAPNPEGYIEGHIIGSGIPCFFTPDVWSKGVADGEITVAEKQFQMYPDKA